MKTGQSVVALGILLLLGTCAVAFVSGMKSDDDEMAAALAKMPSEEAAFANTIAEFGGSKFINANPLDITEVRKQRAEQLCAGLPTSGRVTNWVGRVDSVEATNNGEAIIRVYLYSSGSGSGGVFLENWNENTNAAEDKFPISRNDPSFAIVHDVPQYSLIRFSGILQQSDSDCVRTSGTRSSDETGNLATTMMTPQIIISFSKVERL